MRSDLPVRRRRRRARRARDRATSSPTTRAARRSPFATCTSWGTAASRRSPACSTPRPGADRLRGYRHELQARGLALRDEYVAYGDFYVESGYRAAAELLALPEPPTAIVTASDLTALGADPRRAEAGLRVPEDLSVMGFDDIQLARYLHPPLTTLRQDKASLGSEAARSLLRHVDREDDVPTVVTLPVELIVRGSTAPPPATA